MKNEHIVYAWAPREDGKGYVLIVGLTPLGCDWLKANPGYTLTIQHPQKNAFVEVSDVVVFAAESKQAIKDLLAKAGTVVSEVN